MRRCVWACGHVHRVQVDMKHRRRVALPICQALSNIFFFSLGLSGSRCETGRTRWQATLSRSMALGSPAARYPLRVGVSWAGSRPITCARARSGAHTKNSRPLPPRPRRYPVLLHDRTGAWHAWPRISSTKKHKQHIAAS